MANVSQYSSPLSSVPASRSRSPSESSGSVLSKHSRDAASDDDGGSQASSLKRSKVKPRPVMRKPSGLSAPAEDSQFLTTDGSNARPRSKQASQRRRGFTDDDTESVAAFAIGGLALEDDVRSAKGSKTRKGKGRAQ